MSPYTESETFPRGRRLLLVPVAGVFLVGPYGLMLSGGPGGLLPWVLTATAIVFGALFAGAGIAQPRRTVDADGEQRLVTITQSAMPPRIGVDHRHIPFDEIAAVTVLEVGAARTAAHGYRPVLELRSGRGVPLKKRRVADHAQDVVDHLVLLGLPGRSRAAVRAEALDAAPPATWL